MLKIRSTAVVIAGILAIPVLMAAPASAAESYGARGHHGSHHGVVRGHHDRGGWSHDRGRHHDHGRWDRDRGGRDRWNDDGDSWWDHGRGGHDGVDRCDGGL